MKNKKEQMKNQKTEIKITIKKGTNAGKVGELIGVLSGLNIIEKIESDIMIELIMIELKKKRRSTRG